MSFEWKDTSREVLKGGQMGVIAQEVQKVIPEIVAKSPKTGMLTVADANQLPGLLIEAVKELDAKIEEKTVITQTVLTPPPPEDWEAELATWKGIARGLDLRLKAIEKELAK